MTCKVCNKPTTLIYKGERIGIECKHCGHQTEHEMHAFIRQCFVERAVDERIRR
jgi:transcription elongation factor Elf1